MLTRFFEDAQRAIFIPEVVQTSEMDCGPATLKSMLEGFGIEVSYGRLREACQTDVDGTSIDVLEDVANRLGLQAEQIIIPIDHIFLLESSPLPAIVITRLPEGATHFVVLWRRFGNFVQVMDPGTGRRWVPVQQILDQLYIHTMAVDKDAWWQWAQSDGFCTPLIERFTRLGVDESYATEQIDDARHTDNWLKLATYDAAIRITKSILDANGIEPGEQAKLIVLNLVEEILNSPEKLFEIIPPPFWTVQPIEENDEALLFRGSVMVQVVGERAEADKLDIDELSPELRAALEIDQRRPERAILEVIKEDGILAPMVVVLASIAAAFSVLLEGLLMQGVLSVGDSMTTFNERLSFYVGLVTFFGILLLLEFPTNAMVLKIGRHIESRLRIAFLQKIPQLSDRYFHSRLTSDMVSRAHDLRQLRTLPIIGRSLIITTFQLLFTTIGVIWIDPGSAVIAIVVTVVSIALVLATQPFLMERDLRVQTHTGALSRFYLDSLIGLMPLKTHGAERALRRQYEGLLVEWVRSLLDLIRIDVLLGAIGGIIGWAFSVWILFSFVSRGGEASSGLLLFYWTLSIPALGQSLANQIQQYPVQRNRLLRLLEPLDAPDELALQEFPEDARPSQTLEIDPKATSIVMDDVTVQAGGQTILSHINVTIKPGEHVAIVGPSGAGKSTLVGLLLGWHFPSDGIVWIDNELLDVNKLPKLREQIAWVDPDVYLWNRTLFENLTYGTSKITPAEIGQAIESANLFSVLKRIDGGLQARLGEGGGLVSGGEGQRVRLGRALLRDDVRLVILDEPFRGLDRKQRRELLESIRSYWRDVTIIAVTHDVTTTAGFERVLVVESGEIIEDAHPEILLQKESRYKTLYDTDIAVNEGLWRDPIWRRLWIADGDIQDITGQVEQS